MATHAKSGLGQATAEAQKPVTWQCRADGSACWGTTSDTRGYAAGLQRATNVMLNFLAKGGDSAQLIVDGIIGPKTTDAVNAGLRAMNFATMPTEAIAYKAADIARAFSTYTKTTPNFDPVPLPDNIDQGSSAVVPGGGGLPQPLPPSSDDGVTISKSNWGWWVLGGSLLIGGGVALWYFLSGRHDETVAGTESAVDDASDFGYEEAVEDFIDV